MSYVLERSHGGKREKGERERESAMVTGVTGAALF
jgi:hypothetical protein